MPANPPVTIPLVVAEWRLVPRVFWDGHDEDRVGVTVCCGVLVGVDSGVAVLVVNGKLGTSCQ